MRFLLSAILAFALLVGLAPDVDAGAQWCEADPLVTITTPSGNTVPVYVTNGAQGEEHLPAVLAAKMDYTVQATDGGQATLVRMTVLIADDHFETHFATRSVVSTGPLKTGTIYATATGHSGQAMHLAFKLDVP